LIGGSTSLLLLSFLLANFLGTLFDAYQISQYGNIAVPIFAALLAYLTIKYEAFEPRILFIDTLATGLLILLASIFFVRNESYQIYVNILTFIIALPLCYALVTGIRRENKARKQIEALAGNLEKANIRLKELDQQKSEFISLASHQLRGPLTAIKGYASLILEGDCGPISNDVKESVQTIFKSTEALVIVVGDYLDISRIEQGRMKYDFSDFDLKVLVETVINEMTPTVKLASLDISFDVKLEADHMVHADQGKIKQVITNLIDNAVKYTKKGSIHISLAKEDTKKKLLISIKDTGVGIPPEVLPRLFEKFTRAEDANKTNIMGTGLGLYVAKKMIEAHKGKVWAESEGKGKGSSFFIELDALNESKKIDPQVEKFAKEL
jgi:signal transduction histidine kinase